MTAIKRYKANEKKFKTRTSGMYRSLNDRHAKAGVSLIALTLPEFREWAHRFIGKSCRYCHEKITVKNMSIDHPTPLSRGGTGEISVVCSMCNKGKGDFTDAEYRDLLTGLGILDARHPASKMKMKVLRALKIAASFRFGSDRRAKAAKLLT